MLNGSKKYFAIGRGRVIAQTELIEDGVYPVYSSQTKDEGCLGHINTFDFEGEYITWTTDGVNAGTVFLPCMRQGKFNCTKHMRHSSVKVAEASSKIFTLFFFKS